MGIYSTVIVARTRTISWPSWRPSTGTEPRRGGTDQKGGRRAQRTPPPPPPLPPPPTGNRTFHQQSWLDFCRLQLKKIYSCRLVGSGLKKYTYLPGSYLLRLQLQKTIFFSSDAVPCMQDCLVQFLSRLCCLTLKMRGSCDAKIEAVAVTF